MPPRRQPPVPLGEIAEWLGATLDGPAEKLISGVRPVTTAGPDDITFVENDTYLGFLEGCRAGAVVVDRDTGVRPGLVTLRVDQPYVAFAELLERFFARDSSQEGVSERACVSPDATIGEGCRIHPFACIDRGAAIGRNTEIYPGVYIGEDARLGADCVIHANASIYRDSRIGDRVIVHSGAVIGADGFGFTQKRQADAAEPVIHRKVPQVGCVVIEDDVEIGANSTIDRAALEETRIGRGTKIDNLVMIGHNCRIGRHSILVGQAGISGSTELGSYVTVAGQAGVVGHLKIGDRVTVGAQSGVTRDVPSGAVILGTPAIDASVTRRAWVIQGKLPEQRRRLAALERRVEELEKKSSR